MVLLILRHPVLKKYEHYIAHTVIKHIPNQLKPRFLSEWAITQVLKPRTFNTETLSAYAAAIDEEIVAFGSVGDVIL